MPDALQVDKTYQKLADRLQEMQTSDGYWTGRLSNSALSTATAISALAVCRRERRSKPPGRIDATEAALDCTAVWAGLIENGCDFLCRAQNSDGGFGDTDRSHSNIATTLLVIAAWRLAGTQKDVTDRMQQAQAYVDRQGGWDGLRKRYGQDKTFVVPILSNCALAGMVPWTEVSPLPFEAAALPQAWYRFAQMPVVSYAVPALVAIGQARFIHAPPRNPFLRILRRSLLKRTQRVLRQMQPDSGGYLEATPLTSFVLMNLASIGLVETDVALDCQKFVVDSVQADGSWPIDTNLATWVTSLAIHALLPQPVDSPPANPPGDGYRQDHVRNAEHASFREPSPGVVTVVQSVVQTKSIDWLLSCQHRVRHPFTGAEPGGWGWTNLSGAVPDADDTPAALLALYAWQCDRSSEMIPARVGSAVEHGIQWLLKLQNRDGGWPTFCRGWGKLPFDRSGADLTAHAIRALSQWSNATGVLKPSSRNSLRLNWKTISKAIGRGLRYLRHQQRTDGSWLPLWFGNQDRPDEENPIYGTARVLLALGELHDPSMASRSPQAVDLESARQAIRFLLSQQNIDGGWGGGSSIRYRDPCGDSCPVNPSTAITSTIEESSVVIEGLEACRSQLATDTLISKEAKAQNLAAECDAAIDRGVAWLTSRIDHQDYEISQPIGFYFAKLWYHERLYPYVFAAAALNRVRSRA